MFFDKIINGLRSINEMIRISNVNDRRDSIETCSNINEAIIIFNVHSYNFIVDWYSHSSPSVVFFKWCLFFLLISFSICLKMTQERKSIFVSTSPIFTEMMWHPNKFLFWSAADFQNVEEQTNSIIRCLFSNSIRITVILTKVIGRSVEGSPRSYRTDNTSL